MKIHHIVITAGMLALVASCERSTAEAPPPEPTPQAGTSAGDIEKVVKTEAEWRAQLSQQEYYITREAGTERAFTGTYWNHKETGTYTCVACDLPLFSSDTKFKSGTGWPSYYAPIQPAHVLEKQDLKYGWVRTEVVCARCDAHLGHVFNDGPRPTGLRYCINSAALDFIPREQTGE